MRDRQRLRLVELTDRRRPPIRFVNPYTIPPANIASTYAAALAAAANGQNFGFWDNAGEVLHVYRKGTTGAESGKGVYLGTIPWGAASSTPSSSFQDAVETARLRAAMDDVQPNLRIDLCTVDAYYAVTRVRNRALEAALADANILGFTRPWKLAGVFASGFDAGYPQVANGPDGSAGATRFRSVTAPGQGQGFNFLRLPAGTWTLALDVRNMNTVTPTSVAFGWSSFVFKAIPAGDGAFHVYTVVLDNAAEADGAFFIAWGDGATAFDIIVDDLRMLPGDQSASVAVQATPLTEHPASNWGQSTPRMQRAGKALTSQAGAGQRGTILSALPYQAAARTAFSFCWAMKRLANTANPQAMFAAIDSNTDFTSTMSGGVASLLTPSFYAGGLNCLPAPTGCVDAKVGDEYTIFSGMNGPGGAKIMVDDLVFKDTALDETNPAWSGTVARSLELMTERLSAGEGFEGALASFAAFDRELTVIEMKQVVAATKQRLAALGLTVQAFKNVYIAEGDSITEGPYVGLVTGQFTPRLNAIRLAKINSNLRDGNLDPYLNLDDQTTGPRKNNLLATIAAVVASGRRPIFSVLIGANDTGIITASPATYYSQLQSYWAALRAAGAKVIACTVLPQRTIAQGGSTYTASDNSARLTLNTSIRGAVADGSADAVCDFSASPMDVWSATYWSSDSVHPNATGHNVMMPLMQSAITGLLLS